MSAFGGKADIAWTPSNVHFDPKRTFRLQILTWIKFGVFALELSSMTDWLSAKPAPVEECHGVYIK
jgi:hypothetical protein